MKQKMVIKVCMKCKKCRVKAMEIVAGTSGVKSLALGEDGEITIIGEDVDMVSTVSILRNKLGSATIVSVEEVKEQSTEEKTAPAPAPLPLPLTLPYNYGYPYY